MKIANNLTIIMMHYKAIKLHLKRKVSNDWSTKLDTRITISNQETGTQVFHFKISRRELDRKKLIHSKNLKNTIKK